MMIQLRRDWTERQQTFERTWNGGGAHTNAHPYTRFISLYRILSLSLSANERSSSVVVAASPPRRRHYCCSFLFFRMHFGALPSKKYAPVCTSSMWPFVRWLVGCVPKLNFISDFRYAN